MFKSLEVSKVVLFCSEVVLSWSFANLIAGVLLPYKSKKYKPLDHKLTSSATLLQGKISTGKERKLQYLPRWNMIINNVFKYVAVGVTCSLLMYLCELSLLSVGKETHTVQPHVLFLYQEQRARWLPFTQHDWFWFISLTYFEVKLAGGEKKYSPPQAFRRSRAAGSLANPDPPVRLLADWVAAKAIN